MEVNPEIDEIICTYCGDKILIDDNVIVCTDNMVFEEKM